MSTSDHSRARALGQSGFSMLELIVVLALLVPVLYGIISAPSYISRSVQSNRTEAAVGLKCRMQAERIAGILRGASAGSLLAQVGGLWGPFADDTWYSAIRYQTLIGLPTTSSLPLTAVNTLEFALAPGEAPFGMNGRDDDRDGVADNGFVRLTRGTAATQMTGRVETFRVMKTGRIMRLELGIAERDGGGTIHRRACQVEVMLENN